jgi:hypothetical protein
MDEAQLRQDAEYAHAVFDMLGVSDKNKSGKPLSLRIRALLVAEKIVGRPFLNDEVAARLAERKNLN